MGILGLGAPGGAEAQGTGGQTEGSQALLEETPRACQSGLPGEQPGEEDTCAVRRQPGLLDRGRD